MCVVTHNNICMYVEKYFAYEHDRPHVYTHPRTHYVVGDALSNLVPNICRYKQDGFCHELDNINGNISIVIFS